MVWTGKNQASLDLDPLDAASDEGLGDSLELHSASHLPPSSAVGRRLVEAFCWIHSGRDGQCFVGPSSLPAAASRSWSRVYWRHLFVVDHLSVAF